MNQWTHREKECHLKNPAKCEKNKGTQTNIHQRLIVSPENEEKDVISETLRRAWPHKLFGT